jgi:hypothetical protein
LELSSLSPSTSSHLELARRSPPVVLLLLLLLLARAAGDPHRARGGLERGQEREARGAGGAGGGRGRSCCSCRACARHEHGRRRAAREHHGRARPLLHRARQDGRLHARLREEREKRVWVPLLFSFSFRE